MPYSNSQHVHCIGLSHHTAPVAMREQLSFTADDIEQAFLRAPQFGLSELVILSTCNRLELYACSENHLIVRDFLALIHNVCANRMEPHLYHYEGSAAAEHLCRVAAGLDSMVLGEPQILGQVTTAFKTATAHKALGPQLTRLFRTAIRVGKRARTETDISRNAVSISTAAIQLAQSRVRDLPHKEILLVGAGEMSQLALKHLQSRNMRKISMANRNKNRAANLLTNGRVYGLNELAIALSEADVVFTATGAPHAVIDAKLVQQVMETRHERPLVLIDLAVPRDVAPAVAHLRQVQLYDVDDLQSQVDEALWQRERAIPQVEKIIAAELARYRKQQKEAAVTPIISGLHQRAEEIRRRELERALRFLPDDVDAKTREQFEYFSQSLIKKLLHEPTARLRKEAANEHGQQYAESMRFLFDIQE